MVALTTTLACIECQNEGVLTSIVKLPLSDTDYYECTCPRGHRLVQIVKGPRFELLFEIGARAYADGYTRECVSSFAAGLERFYEFALSVILQNEGSEVRRFEPFDALWREIGGTSERQLGAFLGAWINAFGTRPDVLSQAMSTFRNTVVHKGKIPANEEAAEFAQTVLNIATAGHFTLQEKKVHQIAHATDRCMANAMAKVKAHERFSTTNLGGVFCVSNHPHARDFRAYVEELKGLWLSRGY